MTGRSPRATGVRYVRVGPIRIRVRIVGEGPPLLMIMGLGGNLNMWDPLVAELPGRQLILFDFPGTGWSGQSCLPPTMGSNALIVRLMLRALGYGRVDVVGYSWGGLLAQHLAVQHPGSVRRLVLAATTPGLGGRPPALRTLSRMVTPRRYYSADYYGKVAPTLYGGRHRTPLSAHDEEVRRRTARPPSLIGYASQLMAVAGYSTIPVLPLINAPTLVLAGDDDPIVPTFNPRLIARLIPGATLRILPGSGHLLLLDSPELAGPLIASFLDA
ncbi:MAG: alpha/beta fold hydrolase [Frankiales bacterium]|nr:alpha/beta fold hydrolase [Frankiales bacterium]